MRAFVSLLRFLLCAVLLGAAFPANAQMVDYGSLETLFGEPVTTSASGKPQRASEAPVGLEILSAEQIRRMGVTSLPEVLQRLPGVFSWQGSRSVSDVGIRGQNSPYNAMLLVLVNGRQVYIDTYGYTDWSLIPVQLEEIRQIEVVKGPATAIYGFNAVSGVINIITYNPAYDDKDEVGAAVGTGDYHRAYGFDTFKLSDDAHLRVSGSREGFNEFPLRSKTALANPSVSGSRFNPNPSLRKYAADGVAQLSDATQLRVESSYGHTEGGDVPNQYFHNDTEKHLFSAKSELVSQTAIGQLDANLYTNVSRNTYHRGRNETLSNQVTVAQLQDLFKIGSDHTIRLQGEFRHNVFESEFYLGDGAELAYNQQGVGAMWNWALAPSLEWTNAVRYDRINLWRDGPFSTPAPFTSNDEFDQDLDGVGVNSSLVWQVTPNDSLRASYGRGVEVPPLSQVGIDILFAPGFYVVGNPRLDPAIGTNYELGYDHRLADGKTRWRNSVFYHTTRRVLSSGSDRWFSPAGLIIQSVNAGGSQTLGFEEALNGSFDGGWSWDVSYRYQNTKDDFDALPLRYEGTAPHHVLKAHLGWEGGPWQTDLFAEADSSFDAVSFSLADGNSLVGIDGYTTVGGRVAYTFGDEVTLALSGSDLQQAHTAKSYGLESERRLFLTLSKGF